VLGKLDRNSKGSPTVTICKTCPGTAWLEGICPLLQMLHAHSQHSPGHQGHTPLAYTPRPFARIGRTKRQFPLVRISNQQAIRVAGVASLIALAIVMNGLNIPRMPPNITKAPFNPIAIGFQRGLPARSGLLIIPPTPENAHRSPRLSYPCLLDS